MAAAIWLTLALLPADIAVGPIGGPFIDGLLAAALGGLVGLAAYVLAAWRLGLAEVCRAVAMARHRGPGRRR
jgi:hypothetical protein